MSLIVIFDEGATPEKVLEVRRSTSPRPFIGRTDVLTDPDISALDGVVPRRYWKRVGTTVVEFSAAEKTTQDTEEAAEQDLAVRTGAKAQLNGFSDVPLMLRAFADILKEEINTLRALHSLPDRTLAQLRTAIDGRIDGGSVDS